MAASTSALRRPASARPLRRRPWAVAVWAGEGRDADQGMEQEADQEIDRHPGKIEEGGGARPAEEGAQLVEVAQGQEAVAGRGPLQGGTHHDVEDPPAQGFV
jgi:hypothetical protein